MHGASSSIADTVHWLNRCDKRSSALSPSLFALMHELRRRGLLGSSRQQAPHRARRQAPHDGMVAPLGRRNAATKYHPLRLRVSQGVATRNGATTREILAHLAGARPNFALTEFSEVRTRSSHWQMRLLVRAC